MKIENIKFSAEQLANNGRIRCIGVKPYRDYKDGKPEERIAGFSYECVLINNQYEKINVKIAGAEILANEYFVLNGEPFVEFEGFIGKLYRLNNSVEYALSCKADNMRIVDDDIIVGGSG
jgi:hypothetical protein